MNTGSDGNLFVCGFMQGDLSKEHELHVRFGNVRVRPNAEWFYPSPELIEFINDNSESKGLYVDTLDGKVMVYKTMKLVT